MTIKSSPSWAVGTTSIKMRNKKVIRSFENSENAIMEAAIFVSDVKIT